MAVGDVVVDQLTATANYQPAAGVEVCIVAVGAANGNVALYDGTNSYALVTNAQDLDMKIFINNSDYLRLTVTASTAYYSGVQVK